MKSYSESYKASGVDITAGYKAVELMKSHIARTLTKGAMGGVGGFGGLFELDVKGMEQPVLVSGTDGVGTKLKLAFQLDRHDTVGIDCVAMCVNDVIVCGAKPQFFLDYIACGKNQPEKTASIVKGVCDGCVQAGAALVGGETAEMPGFYPENEYDLAGFCVGLVDKKDILDKSAVRPGDTLIALPSSGPHSNGFSLIRRIIEGMDLTAPFENTTLGDALLCPTKIYVKELLPLIEQHLIKSAAHITGGGFYENIPRSLPEGLSAKIHKQDIRTPAIFHFLMEKGGIPERDMFNTFNMGVGMTLTCEKENALKVLSLCPGSYQLGEIVESGEGVILA